MFPLLTLDVGHLENDAEPVAPCWFGSVPTPHAGYIHRGVKSKEVVIDSFRLWAEDDVICLRAGGPMTSAIVDWIAETAIGILAHHPHYYVLGDLDKAGPISPELRRRLAEFCTTYRPQAISFFHVSVMIRGLNALLFGAVNLLSQRKLVWRQCATETEARRWLDAQRPLAGSSSRRAVTGF
ncbi:MAG: hypothetical protein JNM40_06505 [Myxococcales bacterium]|nr:hypothetical protein [Myxococcales bacterium]